MWSTYPRMHARGFPSACQAVPAHALLCPVCAHAVLYDAGVDPHQDDALGRLSLTDEGLRRRELLVRPGWEPCSGCVPPRPDSAAAVLHPPLPPLPMPAVAQASHSSCAACLCAFAGPAHLHLSRSTPLHRSWTAAWGRASLWRAMWGVATMPTSMCWRPGTAGCTALRLSCGTTIACRRHTALGVRDPRLSNWAPP